MMELMQQTCETNPMAVIIGTFAFVLVLYRLFYILGLGGEK